MNLNNRWVSRYLNLAKEISSWSRDPSTKVGAVIVRPDKTVASLGFNGLPKGVEDLEERLNNRDTKYAFTVHGEKNAILHARERMDGYSLFVYPFMPCADCAGAIIQSGIKTVVSLECDNKRWNESFDFSKQMFSEAGVELKLFREWILCHAA